MLINDEWTTADGEVIPLIEMETLHIYNIINLLKRKKLEGIIKQIDPDNIKMRDSLIRKWVPLLSKELERRDKQYFKEISAKSIHDIFPNMKKDK